jgi:hypothetical protein
MTVVYSPMRDTYYRTDNHKWSFNGIRRYCPDLSYEDWLDICKTGAHERAHHRNPYEVLAALGVERLRRYKKHLARYAV